MLTIFSIRGNKMETTQTESSIKKTPSTKSLTVAQRINKCANALSIFANDGILFADDHNGVLRSDIAKTYFKLLNSQTLRVMLRRIYKSGARFYDTTNPDIILGDWVTPLEFNSTHNKDIVLLAYFLHNDPILMYHFWGLLEDVLAGLGDVDQRIDAYIEDIYLRYDHNTDSSRFITARSMAHFGKLYKEFKPKLKSYVLSSMKTSGDYC